MVSRGPSGTVLRVFGSEVAAVALADTFEYCCAFRWAFSIISSCFDLSFARIGTRSFGTGVFRLKFFENFIRSLSFIALS